MLSGPSFIPNTVNNAIILCHGYGASGDDLADLVPSLSAALPNTAFFCPHAPYELPFGGYEWFSLNDYQPDAMVGIDYLSVLMDRAKPATALVSDFCSDIMRRYGISSGRILVGGFSQGGLVALQTALTFPSPIAGAIGMSAVPVLFGKSFPPESVKQKPPVLLTHGSADPVVPPMAFELNKAQLQSVGISPTTLVSTGLGHGIDNPCLHQVQVFAADCLKISQ